jgi:hypothetical protein
VTSYDDALRALAASEGIEYVDCRVTPDRWETDRPRLRAVMAIPTTALSDDVPAPASPILLRSTYEQLMLDPRHRSAAAKGLKIHEAALARVDREGISYEEALAKERP